MSWRSLLPLFVAAASAHHHLPVNPLLGEPGFPDCWQPAAARLRPRTAAAPASYAWESQAEPGGPWLDARASLRCAQRRKALPTQLSVGCIGDSITAGANLPANSSLAVNKNNSYPSLLQDMLGDGYKVTNLGACECRIRLRSVHTYAPTFLVGSAQVGDVQVAAT